MGSITYFNNFGFALLHFNVLYNKGSFRRLGLLVSCAGERLLRRLYSGIDGGRGGAHGSGDGGVGGVFRGDTASLFVDVKNLLRGAGVERQYLLAERRLEGTGVVLETSMSTSGHA